MDKCPLECIEYISNYLSLLDCMQVYIVNKHFYKIVRHRCMPKQRMDVFKQRRAFRLWKRYRLQRSERMNSWVRNIQHPDERYIF